MGSEPDDDLEARVERLEEQVSETMPSRRQLLAGAGTLGVGALLGGGADTAAAVDGTQDTSDGTVRGNGGGVDVRLDELRDPGGDEVFDIDDTGAINAAVSGREFRFDSINTKNLLNKIGESALHAAWDGLVVPWCTGVTPSGAIDPAATQTPIQDAVDTIEANADVDRGEPQGIVVLPHRSFGEDGTVTFNDGGVAIISLGNQQGATVNFGNNGDSDAFQFDGDSYVYLDGFRIRGGTRSGGSVFHFVNNNSQQINIGQVDVVNWTSGSDPWIHFDTATAFQSEWGRVAFRGCDADNGTFCTHFDGDGGNAFRIRELVMKPASSDPQPFRYGFAGGTVQIDHLNCSGESSNVGLFQGNQGGVHIGTIHFEGADDQNLGNTGIFIQGSMPLTIGEVNLGPTGGGGGPSFNKLYDHSSGGNNWLGPATGATGNLTDVVELNGINTPSWFRGSRNDVQNRDGAGSPGAYLWCMEENIPENPAFENLSLTVTSGGTAVADTGLTNGSLISGLVTSPQDAGEDVKFRRRWFWDDSTGTVKVELVDEQSTGDYDVKTIIW